MAGGKPGGGPLLAQAVALHRAGRIAEAEALYRRCLAARPNQFEALHMLGVLLAETGRLADALRLIERSVKLAPKSVPALTNLGDVLLDLQRPADALTAYERALREAPGHPTLLNNRGNALAALQQHRQAVTDYQGALAAEPGFVEAHVNLANALAALGQDADAVASFDRALQLAPGYAMAWHNRGIVLQSLGRPEDALASHQRAVALQPQLARAWCEIGTLQRALGQEAVAMASFRHVLQIAPQDAAGWLEQAHANWQLGDSAAALRGCERALALQPDFTAALILLADVLRSQKRLQGVVECYDRVLAGAPGNAEIRYQRALVLRDLGRFEAAIADFDAVASAPGFGAQAFSLGLLTRLQICDWRRFAGDRDRLIERIAADAKVDPFVPLVVLDDPAVHRHAAQTWAARAAEGVRPVPRPPAAAHDRLRIAYVSADFRVHAIGQLTAELFERHDRRRFEIYGVSLHPSDNSALRQRLEAGFDHFIDATAWDDAAVAEKLVELGIDIAVDVTGYTAGQRAGIFARHPAPVQVNFLGYPGTLGAGWMDYLIADRIVIPPGREALFAEQVVIMPDTYQVNASTQAVAATPLSRRELGLPDDGVVFCCFNQMSKITPEVFTVWMRLLHQVEGSVLWLYADNTVARSNLCAAAEAHGVAPARLVFADYADNPTHLARLAAADLFLDTLPYNAHTTGSDALRMGVPLVTLPGESFAARVAASLLHAIGVTETIAASRDAYEQIALRLAREPAYRQAIRQRLLANQATHPLFDTARYCRHLEDAYATMWSRYLAGERPIGFTVPPVASR